MSTRKSKPTPRDVAAAKRLKAIWVERARTLDPPLTQEGMAGLMGGTQGLVSQYLNGHIPLNFKAVMHFAHALGVDPREIRDDLEEMQLAPGVATGDTDWTEVKAAAQAVSLGSGALVDEYQETQKLKFKASSLRKKGLRPDTLQVYYGDGDSMAPRIRNGDAIMFDTSDTRIVDDNIYVVRYDGHIYAKRLQRLGAGLIAIVSDNRDDPRWRKPVVVTDTDDFEVLGRVRWIGSWED
jgi:phage repressor protein C with HTH and peptisase S24 domain